MTKLQQALESINFDESNEVGGDYGLHHGFFNALVKVDGVNYYVQGCADNDSFDSSDCGHDDGICGELNYKLAKKLAEDKGDDLSLGYEDVQLILEAAYAQVS